MRCHQIPLPPQRAISRLAVFCTLMLSITLLAACGVAPASDGTPTATAIRATATPLVPTSMTIVRFSAKDNRVLPFQQTTQDATKVQQLYHSLDTLPYKVSSISCPLYAYGMGYELSFMHDSTLVLQVILETCYGVKISNSSDCRQWTPALTTQIAATFDVPASILETKNLINSAGPNGPFAQPAPTPPILIPARCF